MCGFKYIDNWKYYKYDASEENALLNTFFKPKALNIYFVDEITRNGAPLCGYAYYPHNSKFPNGAGMLIMDRSCGVKTFIHEVGHALNLRHTHNTYGGKEFVTRDVYLRNCFQKGDGFCDTPADPNIYGKVDYACKYTGNARDPRGQRFTPKTGNHMSYSLHHCRNKFTRQQRLHMYNQATLIKQRGNSCNSLSSFSAGGDPGVGENAPSTADVVQVSKTFSFELYPNPAKDQINLMANLAPGNYLDNLKLQVFDLQGQQVLGQKIGQMDGQGEVAVSLDGLGRGLYLVMVTDGERRSVLRFTKQ